MQELIHIVPAPESHVHVRLVLESFDCGDECSFEHWAEVHKLIEESDGLSDTELQILEEPANWN
jgi:hypothetical protein